VVVRLFAETLRAAAWGGVKAVVLAGGCCFALPEPDG